MRRGVGKVRVRFVEEVVVERLRLRGYENFACARFGCERVGVL